MRSNKEGMKNIEKKECEIKDFFEYFIKKNGVVTVLGGMATLYCIVCAVFKGSSSLNIHNELVRCVGDLLYNIGISIIAAYIFLLFQSWLFWGRERSIAKYAKRYVKQFLLRDCMILQEQLKLIQDEKKKEEEINQQISFVCERLREEILLSTTKYRDGLSDGLFRNIDELYFDNVLLMIEKRANGKYPNENLKRIIQNSNIYGRLNKLIQLIGDEVRE